MRKNVKDSLNMHNYALLFLLVNFVSGLFATENINITASTEPIPADQLTLEPATQYGQFSAALADCICPTVSQQSFSSPARVRRAVVDGAEITAQFVAQYVDQQNWGYITIVSAGWGSNGAGGSWALKRLYQVLASRAQVTVTLLTNSSDPFTLPNKDPEYRMQFLVLWETLPNTLREYMVQAGTANMFTKQQDWLLLVPPSVTDISQQLKGLQIFVDSEVVSAAPMGGDETLKLTEHWSVGVGGPSSEGAVGTWSPGNGIQRPSLQHKYDRRKNLMGYKMIVSTIKTMPYESLTVDDSMQNFKSGYVVDVWHTLQEQLNFTYHARHTLFGSLQADGVSWNGMVGDVQNRVADVAVAPLSITKIRSLSIDFTIPVQTVSTRLYIRRPVLEASWSLYWLPFDSMLWICVPCGVLLSSISVWGLNSIAYRASVTPLSITILETLWTLFSGLVQQGATLDPKPISGKIMLFTSYWTSLILYTCYSAVLVSILTTMMPMLPFQDFTGMLENPNWDLGVRTNTALADALALAPPMSPMRLAWERHVVKNPDRNLVRNNDAALANVQEGQYAFFANKEYIIYRLHNVLPLSEAMSIVDTGKDFLVRGIGFGLQKNSPYRHIFNHVLSKMGQSGHMQRLKTKWWPDISREPPTTYPTPGLKEVFTVFMVWGLGSVLAGAVLVIEIFIRRSNNQSQLSLTSSVGGWNDNKP